MKDKSSGDAGAAPAESPAPPERRQFLATKIRRVLMVRAHCRTAESFR